MAISYIGIGSNIGDKQRNVSLAAKLLKETPGVLVVRSSSFYTTEPVGGPPQEDYLNGVLEIETSKSPEELLSRLKQIEKDMGRLPSGRNFPRIIDLDILLFEKNVTKTDNLEIPHPRMHERSFVLKGLNEIAPHLVHPVLGNTINEIYEQLR